jgi:tRNA nucleotidyltransferase/poly(A) polymerase
MNLEEIYKNILDISSSNYMPEPLIVGGIPRDIYLNKLDKRDVDLTTNDADSPRLGISTAIKLNLGFKMFEDAHVSVYAKGNVIDFSGNFISDKAVEFAKSEYGVEDQGLFEAYSRDFTINTLHKKLFDHKLLDITDLAIKDLEGKIIRPVTTSEICFEDDLRRIFRAVNFAARLGFSIDGSIIDYAKSNVNIISREMGRTLRDAFVTSIVSESISEDAEKTLGYLTDMGILSLIPLVGAFKEELIKRRMVAKYLDDSITLNDKSQRNAYV